MDLCNYCKDYHPEWRLCKGYIDWLERSKIQQASQEHPSVETNAKRATNEEGKR